MKTLLVIEDDVELRHALTQVLKERYSVLEATDGQEGIIIIIKKHGQIDLIITDLGLPRIRGEEVIRFAKGKYPDIKIIALDGEKYSEPVARAAGCDFFLDKPFTLAVLDKEVERLIR